MWNEIAVALGIAAAAVPVVYCNYYTLLLQCGEADGGGVAVGVDEGEGVGTAVGDDFEFVLAVGGCAEEGAVEVPVDGALGVAVGGGADDALAAGIKGYRSGDLHAFLRIYDFYYARRP